MRSLSALSLLAFLAPVLAQDGGPIDFEDGIHNVTGIWGTWSSGSQQVLTGPGFANPVESTFTYPPVGGISYSFTQDGYFEEALYRFKGNGTDPRCIVGVVQYQHGTYEILFNGSMILTPWAEDGRQQIQDPCAAESNILRQFNQTTFFRNFRIFRDPQGRNKLHIFAFDGAPFAPMFQVSETPTMLPTRQLTNTSIGAVAPSKFKKRSINPVDSSSSASTSPSLAHTGLVLASATMSLILFL